MAAAPQTTPPSTLSGHSARRKLGIVEDCRERLRSIGEALDHFERNVPDGVETKAWEHSVVDMANRRVELMLELDDALAEFPSAANGRAVMVLLADVKRLEGKLASLLASHDLRAPDGVI